VRGRTTTLSIHPDETIGIIMIELHLVSSFDL